MVMAILCVRTTFEPASLSCREHHLSISSRLFTYDVDNTCCLPSVAIALQATWLLPAVSQMTASITTNIDQLKSNSWIEESRGFRCSNSLGTFCPVVSQIYIHVQCDTFHHLARSDSASKQTSPWKLRTQLAQGPGSARPVTSSDIPRMRRPSPYEATCRSLHLVHRGLEGAS